LDERLKEFPFATTTLAVTILLMAWFVTGFFPTEASLEAVWWDESAVAEGEYWRAITAILAHGGILHMSFNLLALISFGPLVERRIGSFRFTLLFFGAGFASLFAHALYRPDMPVVGASGSIFGILGLLMILSPRLRLSLFFVWDTSILTFGALYAAFVPILLQLGGVAAFIAHEAHLGGMVFGTIAAFAVDWKKSLHVMPAALSVFILLTLLVSSWIRFLAQVPCDFTLTGLFEWLGCVLLAAWADTWFFILTILAIIGTTAAYTYIEVKKL
jgi:membrane associated rhomboid family serine protease